MRYRRRNKMLINVRYDDVKHLSPEVSTQLLPHSFLAGSSSRAALQARAFVYVFVHRSAFRAVTLSSSNEFRIDATSLLSLQFGV